MAKKPDTPKWNKLRGLPKPRHGTGNGFLLLRYIDPATFQISDTPGRRMELWVDDMTADFSLTGSTAQSVAKRDFYPRNFNQPAYKFHGQTFSERHYGRLGEFIRWAQLECLFRHGIMQIFLPAAGPEAVWRGTGPDHLDPRVLAGKLEHHQKKEPTTGPNAVGGIKGRRQAIWLEGYVANMQRSHEVGVNAPEWEFSFVVSRMRQGPMVDEEVSPQVLPVNWDSFVRRDSTGFVRDPNDILLTQDKGKAEPPNRIPPRTFENIPEDVSGWLTPFGNEDEEREEDYKEGGFPGAGL